VPDEYMSAWEFSWLPADVQHAVWRAHAEHRIDALEPDTGTSRRYNRSQVLAIQERLRETAAAR
jgi:hypothetical protein